MQEILRNVPQAVLIAFMFMIGAFFGSFMNVVIYRFPRKCMSIAKPSGSFCPKCKAKIHWYDNIPIFSYIFLGAKCRNCKQKISLRYPVVEFITAVLFAVLFWQDILSVSIDTVNYMNWLLLLSHLIAVFLLLAIAFIDFDLMIIPDSFSIGGAIILLIFAFLNPIHGGFISDHNQTIKREQFIPFFAKKIEANLPNPQRRAKLINQGPFSVSKNEEPVKKNKKPWEKAKSEEPVKKETSQDADNKGFITESNWVTFLNSLFGSIVGGVGLFVLSILMTLVFLKKARQYGGGMALGMGDVKLYFFFGAMLGWPALPMILILGSFIGVIFGIPLMLTKSKHIIPFGPSLVTAAIIVLLFYGPILRLISDYLYM